jgi:D-glycero-D-manno-heptose 1,7-bisphosphate phosphatase
MKRALFLDRDGVINVDRGYVYRKEEFVFVDGIFDLCRYMQGLGNLIIIVTNQAGIGRGYYSEKDFQVLTNWMCMKFLNEGIIITDVYHCPYHPLSGVGRYKKDSECRKPKPGMLIKAAKKYQIDLSKSTLIGDKITDIEAGLAAGIRKNILLTSEHIENNKFLCVLNLNSALNCLKKV